MCKGHEEVEQGMQSTRCMTRTWIGDGQGDEAKDCTLFQV